MDKRQRAQYLMRIKKGILTECVLVVLAVAMLAGQRERMEERRAANNPVLAVEDDYIKWVDFTVSYEAMCNAYEWDVKSHGTEHELHWVELLAYTAAKTGGTFDKSALKTMEKAAQALFDGEKTLEELTEKLQYYPYYKEAYDAAIGGLVGEYEEEKEDGTYETRYGLKGYFPLARGFDYTHYDDFGVSRSYGYKRRHLGHDMMGLTGTPIGIKCRMYSHHRTWDRAGISEHDREVIPI